MQHNLSKNIVSKVDQFKNKKPMPDEPALCPLSSEHQQLVPCRFLYVLWSEAVAFRPGDVTD